MSILGHIPLGVGIVLLALAAVIIWLRPSENSPLTVMFLAGVALIFLSDPRISNLKFGASGVEVIRDKLIETQQDVGAQIAALRSDVEKQKQILDQHQRLFEAKQPAPDAASRPAAAPAAAAAAAEVKAIESKFSENSQYSVLVFFRQGQRTAAEALSGKLVEQGYKSSAIATDLTEISVPGISGDPRPGTIVIARRVRVRPELATAVSERAAEVAKQYNLGPPIVNNDEWPFRRGDIQVYMF